MSKQTWNEIYRSDHAKWKELWLDEHPDADYYEFSDQELESLFKTCFLYFFHSLLVGTPVPAKDIIRYIKDRRETIEGVNVDLLIKIVNECFKKKHVIDIQHSFTMLCVYVKSITNTPMEAGNINYAKEVLSAFGRRKGFTFESLKNPGLHRDLAIQQQFNTEDDEESDSGSDSGSDSDSDSDSESESGSESGSESESESGSSSEFDSSGSEVRSISSDSSVSSGSSASSSSSEDVRRHRRGSHKSHDHKSSRRGHEKSHRHKR